MSGRDYACEKRAMYQAANRESEPRPSLRARLAYAEEILHIEATEADVEGRSEGSALRRSAELVRQVLADEPLSFWSPRAAASGTGISHGD